MARDRRPRPRRCRPRCGPRTRRRRRPRRGRPRCPAPMPLPAPVTIATRPSSRNSIEDHGRDLPGTSPLRVAPHDRCGEGNRRCAAVRVGREHARLRGVPRRRVGAAGRRRHAPVREALPRRLPGRALVAHDPAQARELPQGVRGFRRRRRSRASARATSSGCMQDAGIVRNRGKIEATIANAAATRRRAGASTDRSPRCCWSFEPNGRRHGAARVRRRSRVDDRRVEGGSRRSCSVSGSASSGRRPCTPTMQSRGIVNDHLVGLCRARAAVKRSARATQPASAFSIASTSSVASGLDHRREAGDDLAVAADEELLEVPADVAGVALGVGGRRELLVQRVAVVAVHLDLLGERERHVVVGAAERLDLVGACPAPARRTGCTGCRSPRSPGRRTCSSSCSSPSYCGVRPQNDATFTSSVTLPFSSASTPGVPSRAADRMSYTDIGGSFRSVECRQTRSTAAESSSPAESDARRGRRAAIVARSVPPRPMCSGCHFEPMPAVRRRRHPRVDREQAVLLPRVVGVERRRRLGEQLAVARDERALVRARGPRSGSSCTARTRRRACRARGRSPPSRGSRCGRRRRRRRRGCRGAGRRARACARPRGPQRARCRRARAR